MAVGKNITWKKGKRKQYNLPYNIQAIWKNIKWGRGKEDGNFWKNMKILENGSGEEHKVVWNFYRLLIKIIDFYFPLFYYCLMTSAGGNVT